LGYFEGLEGQEEYLPQYETVAKFMVENQLIK
jgi:hypothetical protein